MATEIKLLKGEYMEEKLKRFFLKNGFFVVRGLKFAFDGFEVTDIDLWLYSRPSFMSRERTIVDIKNKKTPQAIERIFWTKGLKEVLKVDECIVATTERRNTVRNFGRMNGVTVLDGGFLKKLPDLDESRLSEEHFTHMLKMSETQESLNDYSKRYERMKRILLGNLDFGAFNSLLQESRYFYIQILTNPIQRIDACRLLYCSLSFMLIVLDFVMKDLSNLDDGERKARLQDGFKYGSSGRAGIEKTLDLAIKLSNQPASKKQEFLAIYEELPTELLKEYFGKFDNTNRLFRQAVLFENAGFSSTFVNPLNIDTDVRSIISLFLDFHNINRRHFFEVFQGHAM